VGIWERGDFEPQRHKGHEVWGTTKAQRSQSLGNHKGTKVTKFGEPQRHKGHKVWGTTKAQRSQSLGNHKGTEVTKIR